MKWTCRSDSPKIAYDLVMESSADSSLGSNFHHQIIFARLNLKIYYPLPYEYEIWHKKANVNLIQQAIHEFNGEKAFHRKNINGKVFILNNTIAMYFRISFPKKL